MKNRICNFFYKFGSLFKLKLKFSLPPKKKIVVFDEHTYDNLKYVIDDYDYFVLKDRFDFHNIIYFHPFVISKFLKNFKLKNIWSTYLISLIEIINPRVVLTFTDNSFRFFEASQELGFKINFFAVQNGARYDFNKFKFRLNKGIIKEDFTKRYFIPNFFCFGDFEKQDYQKNKINVQNFYPVGSLRLSNFLFEKKKEYLTTHKKKYDILLISDGIKLDINKSFGTNKFDNEIGEFYQNLIKYVIENNLNFICSFKRLNSTKKKLNDEIAFYKKYLNKTQFNYLMDNSTLKFEKKSFLTYELMIESELLVSIFSTMLRECLSINKKALAVNFSNNDIFDFPIDGSCKIDHSSYQKFSKKLTEILAMPQDEFNKKMNKQKNFLMNYDNNESTILKIKKVIDPIINY